MRHITIYFSMYLACLLGLLDWTGNQLANALKDQATAQAMLLRELFPRLVDQNE